jgi:adenylylsulfate kinase
MPAENIYPISDQLLRRPQKESQLGCKGAVFWLCGLSGSGKSTLAIELEKRLAARNLHSIVLDGDNLRSTLNNDLGFSDEDREENLRRVSEVAKLLVTNGMLVIASFITPLEVFREQAKGIIGSSDYFEVYVKASFDACRKRDVKGLYAKANDGEVSSFTGQGSSFEQPISPWLTIDTENTSLDQSAETLLQSALKVIQS